jgi:hypothetical protein
MIKLLKIKKFFFVIVILFIIIPRSLLAQSTVTISTFEEDTAVVKASILLKKAYEKLGVKMQLARLPASRALIEANKGEIIENEFISKVN